MYGWGAVVPPPPLPHLQQRDSLTQLNVLVVGENEDDIGSVSAMTRS